jgi:hypothetical protein
MMPLMRGAWSQVNTYIYIYIHIYIYIARERERENMDTSRDWGKWLARETKG